VPGTNYYRYTFASDSAAHSGVTVGPNTLAPSNVCAIGNADKGWFTVRSNQNGFLYTELRYWASFKGFKNVSLIPGINSVLNTGAGNGTNGVMTSVGGNTVPATTSVISYSSSTIAAGTTLLGPCQFGSAVGAPDHALFGLMGSSIPQTNKYFYANNSVSSGTNLTLNVTGASPSIGNAVAGIFCQGNSTTNTCKYVHAGDTCAASTNLLRPTLSTRAFNNDVVGVISKGTNTAAGPINMLWSFANDGVAASTMTILGGITCGTANGIPGLSA
jgi:hypothetical protein